MLVDLKFLWITLKKNYCFVLTELLQVSGPWLPEMLTE